MSEISDLEARIKSAFDRIERGLDGLDAGDGASTEDVIRLEGRLEEERDARKELEDRLVAMQEEHDAHVAKLYAESEAQRIRMRDLDDTLQRLRQANAGLRENNKALREANEEGIADAELIEAGLRAELEALRATQGADRAEADAILGELRPMLRAASDAGSV